MRLIKITHLYPSGKSIVLKIVASGKENYASRISRLSTPNHVECSHQSGADFIRSLETGSGRCGSYPHHGFLSQLVSVLEIMFQKVLMAQSFKRRHSYVWDR